MIRLVSEIIATIRSRRRTHSSAFDPGLGKTAGPTCTICGNSAFKEGPNGRRSRTGKLPACESCGSLERHRIVRAVWNSLAGPELLRMRGLQFSPDPSVDQKWFDSFEISIHGGRNSLNLESIERPSESL